MELTVIVPTYNVEKYIKRCLDSILMQSFTDYELIVLDDGSSDLTQEIIREYAKKEKRIVPVYFDVNRGAAAVRQHALDISSGRYIMFMDSDDRYTTDQALSLMVDTMNRTGADCVTGRYRISYSSRLVRENGPARLKHGMTNKEMAVIKLKQPKFFWHYLVIHCYRARIIKENDIRFDSKFRFKEDMKFNYDYMLHAKSYDYINQCIYEYNRANESSVTRTKYTATLARQKELFIRAKELNRDLTDIYRRMGLYSLCKKDIAAQFYAESISLIRSLKEREEYPVFKALIEEDSDYRESKDLLGCRVHCIRFIQIMKKIIRRGKNYAVRQSMKLIHSQ